VSHPFIVWTLQRTGGTSLTELLMAMSEHKSADHEPFNWRHHKPRQFGHIARNWVETKDDAALDTALTEIFAARFLIKHCYELHGTLFSSRLVRAAARTNYRHVLLLRRDELSRLVSKYIAEANGTWFKDYAAKVYTRILARERAIAPLPIGSLVKHFTHCRRVTAQLRELFYLFNVDTREIYYEDLYLGDRAARLSQLNDLFEFIGFTPETIAAHQPDIEEKIFTSGQNTADVMPFVPNLEKVRNALAAAGYGDAVSAGEEAVGWRGPVGDTPHPDRPVEDYRTSWRAKANQTAKNGMPLATIFTRDNGFAAENGLGYAGKQLNRLNARYRTFIQPNVEKINGRRVLDLASHDGHWSLACLMHGAAHVTGVEIREDLLDKSCDMITEDMQDRIRFIHGDIFDVLPRLAAADERFDVILCLGIFYLIMDHHRLLQLMHMFCPKLIILDTNLVDNDDAFIKLRGEPIAASPPTVGRKVAVTGVVSRGAMTLLAAQFGYSARYEEWDDAVSNRDGLHDYYATNKIGVRRYTLYLEPWVERLPSSRDGAARVAAGLPAERAPAA
jgi:hypothetical protein